HEINKWKILLRLDEVNTLQRTEHLPYRLLNIGIEMNRVDDIHVTPPRDPRQSRADPAKPFAEALTPVPRDQHKPPARLQEREPRRHLPGKRRIISEPSRDLEQGIDNCVARDMNLRIRDPLR